MTMSVVKPTYKYVVMDPLQPQWDIPTERKTIKPGKWGWGRTDDAGLAQEIKQRRPWTIVKEYEDTNNGWATRATFRMPLAPWKFDLERQNKFAEMFNAYYEYLNRKEEEDGESTDG